MMWSCPPVLNPSQWFEGMRCYPRHAEGLRRATEKKWFQEAYKYLSVLSGN